MFTLAASALSNFSHLRNSIHACIASVSPEAANNKQLDVGSTASYLVSFTQAGLHFHTFNAVFCGKADKDHGQCKGQAALK